MHADLDTSNASSSSDDQSKIMLVLNDIKGQLDAMKSQFDCLLVEVRDNSAAVKDVVKKLDEVEERASANTAEIQHMREDLSAKDATLRKMSSRIDKAFENFDKMGADLNKTKERCSNLEKKVYELTQKSIDQEARSRRNNLMFYGVPETDDDNASAELQKFLIEKCGIANGKDLLIQRVHRLPTRKLPGKTRPIIASFVDFRQRELVRNAKKNLTGRQSISEDLPKPIRDARRLLSAEFNELQKNKSNRLGVAYPCKLICNGKVIRIIDPVTMKNLPVH